MKRRKHMKEENIRKEENSNKKTIYIIIWMTTT